MIAAGRLANGALLALPGALIVFLSFSAGGFFPDAQALAALVLAAVLGLRIALAEAPFAGFGKWVAVAAGALALLGLWTLLSGLWSDAPARALLEFNRVLLYLLAVLLFGSLPHTTMQFRWILRGLALGILVVCISGLVTRVLPDLWPISQTLAENRLSYPLTYWNALGLLASVGIILCFHFASSRSEPPPLRVFGAAAVPLLAVTLFFTFSRGAIAAGILGLAAYVVLGRPRAMLSGLLAVGPATAIAVVNAYDANLLATVNPTSAGAVEQGHEVALVAAVCAAAAGLSRLLLLRLDPHFDLGRIPARAGRLAAGGGVAAVVVTLLVMGAPGYVADQYDRFAEGGGAGEPGDLRTRLTDPASSGRLESWDVAIEAFQDAPLAGEGAGTYETVWARDRPIAFSVTDAHSLYAEVLAELGVVGFALLLIVLGAIVGGLVARSRGPHRTLYVAALAAVLTWAVHAGVDWDWEMPAVTLWVFVVGAAALSARGRDRPGIPPPGAGLRLAAVAGCLALAVVPGLVLVSEDRLSASADAFERGDCRTAVEAAGASISALSVRPEPYELRAYCRLRAGRVRAAIQDLERSVDRDPQNWVYRYGLSVARGAAGLDPRSQARAALRNNPLDPEARELVTRFATDDPRAWRRRATALLAGASPFYVSTR